MATTKDTPVRQMMLKNVRLSFPSLFKKAVFEGKETKYEASFIIDNETQADQIEALEKMINDFAEEKFGKGKVPKSLKITCLTDGNTKDYDGYENATIFKGGSTRRIAVIDRDRTPLAEEDGKLLEGGDYVNALISLWYSEHPKGGKQILGNVSVVQFAKHGESFSAGAVSDEVIDELFDDIEDDDEF